MTIGTRMALGLALAASYASGLQARDDRRISIDWRGGTLERFIEQLRQSAQDVPVNVIVDTEAAAWQVQPLALRQLSPEQAVMAVPWATDVPEGMDLAVEPLLDDSGRPVVLSLVVRRHATPTTQRLAAKERVRPNVLSIRTLLEGRPGEDPAVVMDAETVLTAVQAALDMADADDRPAELKFHQDSGLLIVQGDEWELETADRVVRLLAEDIHERRAYVRQVTSSGFAERMAELTAASKGDRELQLIELQGELRQAELGLQQAELVAQDAAQRAEYAAKLYERAAVSESEVRAARLRAEQERLNVDMRRSELERIQQRLELVERRVSEDGRSRPRAEEIATTELHLQNLQAMCQAKREEIAQMEPRIQVDVSPRQIEAARQQLMVLEAQVATTQAHLERLRSEAGNGPVIQQVEAQTRAQLLELERQNAALAVRNEELDRSLRSRSAEVEDLRARLAALEAQIRPR